jgi:hypothetical protein
MNRTKFYDILSISDSVSAGVTTLTINPDDELVRFVQNARGKGWIVDKGFITYGMIMAELSGDVKRRVTFISSDLKTVRLDGLWGNNPPGQISLFIKGTDASPSRREELGMMLHLIGPTPSDDDGSRPDSVDIAIPGCLIAFLLLCILLALVVNYRK